MPRPDAYSKFSFLTSPHPVAQLHRSAVASFGVCCQPILKSRRKTGIFKGDYELARGDLSPNDVTRAARNAHWRESCRPCLTIVGISTLMF